MSDLFSTCLYYEGVLELWGWECGVGEKGELVVILLGGGLGGYSIYGALDV